MGYNQIVVALLLLATATPLAYAILPGLNPAVANITGRICCTPTGNCENGSVGGPGVEVDLNCTTVLRSVVTLARAVTGLNGTVVILVNNVLGAAGLPRAGQIAQCNVVSRLPLNATVCPILATSEGVLTSALTIAGTVFDTVLGVVINITAVSFQVALTT